jgi:hypothetical protein
MQLKPVATFDTIEPEVFKRDYYRPGVPVVIRNLSHTWPALQKWNWDYFKELVGEKKVPLYNKATPTRPSIPPMIIRPLENISK